MDAQKASYSITLMANVLGVTRAGYYVENRAPQRGRRASARRADDAWENRPGSGWIMDFTYLRCARTGYLRRRDALEAVAMGTRALSSPRSTHLWWLPRIVLHADRGPDSPPRSWRLMRAVGRVSMGRAGVCWITHAASLTTDVLPARLHHPATRSGATWNFYNPCTHAPPSARRGRRIKSTTPTPAMSHVNLLCGVWAGPVAWELAEGQLRASSCLKGLMHDE